MGQRKAAASSGVAPTTSASNDSRVAQSSQNGEQNTTFSRKEKNKLKWKEKRKALRQAAAMLLRQQEARVNVGVGQQQALLQSQQKPLVLPTKQIKAPSTIPQRDAKFLTQKP